MTKFLDKVYPKSHWIVLGVYLFIFGLSFCPVFNDSFDLFVLVRYKIYPQILVSLSIFFGFILASISLIISISDNPVFVEFRNTNNSAESIWDTFIKSLKYLGLGCIISLILLIVDGENSTAHIQFIVIVRWIAIFIYLKICEKLFWAFILLYLLIETIKKNWKKDRTAHLKNQNEAGKAKIKK